MRRHRRLVVGYAALVVVVLVAFALVYNYGMDAWENRPEPLYRSIQVVVQTVTTVGYGGDAPYLSPEMNYLVTAMQVSGLVLIFAALPVLVVPLFEDVFRTTAPTSVGDLADHVVICNYGPREEVLVDELTRREVGYVLVVADRPTANDLYTDGYSVVAGDPESEETLRGAGLERAAALVVDVGDETNPSVLLAGQAVDPDVHTVSLVEDPSIADYHRYAGADDVFAPRELLGENLAGKASGSFSPEAVDPTVVGRDLELAEFPVQTGSELIGDTIAGSRVRERTGATVLGAWHRGEFESPPPRSTPVDARTILVAVGTDEALDALKELTLSGPRSHRGHAVVVGMGVVGRTVALALAEAGHAYATVDREARPDVDVVGDATSPEALREADVGDAATVVLALSNDATAIFVTFVIRELNPGVEIIARANNFDSVSKLYRAGADYVLSLASVTGRVLATTVLAEEVVSATTQIKLVRTTAPGLAGDSLAAADVRARTGCTVVAVEREGTTLTDVDGEFVVRPGDELVVAGTDENTDRFVEEFA